MVEATDTAEKTKPKNTKVAKGRVMDKGKGEPDTITEKAKPKNTKDISSRPLRFNVVILLF